MPTRYPLTDLPRALIEAGYDSPSYRSLYEAARSARIPATRSRNGRWTFDLQDIPEIADRVCALSASAA